MTGPRLLSRMCLYPCALAALVTTVLSLPLAAAAEQVVETHPDGSPSIRYTTDAQGRKDGPYEELFPGGKPNVKGAYLAGERHGNWTRRNEAGKVVSSATYRIGVLHGPYALSYPSGRTRLRGKYRDGALAGAVTVLDEKGKVQRTINYLRPRDEVEKAWAALHVRQPGPPRFAEEPSLERPHRAGKLAQETLDEALRMVQLYRCLSGLSWQDVKVDPALCQLAQHGAVVLTQLGYLSHTPPKPDGMDEAFYKLGYAGCKQSNLHQGQGTVVEGIVGFMDDSDASNITHIGHRQWVLAPGLQRVGFGTARGFVAMHVLEANRNVRAPRGFVPFPGDGYYPRELLKPHYAWSVHFDRDRVKMDRNPVKIQVTRLDEFFAEAGDVPARVVSFAPGAHNSAALIFQVSLERVEAARYWVSIRGLADAKGKPAPPLEYVVDLIEMPDAVEAPSEEEDVAGGGGTPGIPASRPPRRVRNR